jgi:hypothetical protein
VWEQEISAAAYLAFLSSRCLRCSAKLNVLCLIQGFFPFQTCKSHAAMSNFSCGLAPAKNCHVLQTIAMPEDRMMPLIIPFRPHSLACSPDRPP